MNDRITETPDPLSDDRRAVLLCLGASALAALCGAFGCRTESPSSHAAGVTRIPLAEIPPASRRVVLHENLPVEIVRESGAVRARSLQCTHMGCQVAWNEAIGMYRCPCHDGRYDAAGKPRYGPPTQPLASVPVRVEGDEIVLGG